uniref:Uncharacterized protein n=1 Tax=Arion vulgaris TaxID=1028688 RepID=A0A0B6Y8Y2_9EUPU
MTRVVNRSVYKVRAGAHDDPVQEEKMTVGRAATSDNIRPAGTGENYRKLDHNRHVTSFQYC